MNTILIVEDKDFYYKGFETILTPYYKIFRARSWREAIEIIEVHKLCPEVVLLDMNFPIETNEISQDKEIGLKLLDRIKKFDKSIQVIINSSENEYPTLAKKAKEMGAFDYILKEEMTKEILLTTIKRAIKERN